MILISGVELPIERIADVCRRYEVQDLSVFGSAARGDMRPESDIDILADFKPGARIGLIKFATLNEELTGLLGRNVDLVTKHGLKPRVRPHVLREAQRVYP